MSEPSKPDREKQSYAFDPIWAEVTKRFIKSEKAKSGLTFQQISEKLEQKFNTLQTDANLKSKIGAGNFGAQLFLQLLAAMGTKNVSIADVEEMYRSIKEEKE